MLGALGYVLPELWAHNYVKFGEAVWLKVEAQTFNQEGLDYFDNPSFISSSMHKEFCPFGQPVIQMGTIEGYRITGELFGKVTNPFFTYGSFDPLDLIDDPEAFVELKLKEIMNGRLVNSQCLAFLSMLL